LGLFLLLSYGEHAQASKGSIHICEEQLTSFDRCIPLSTLFTPATLSVGHVEKLEFANMQVLKMDISNSSLERVFTYRTRADIWVAGASARLESRVVNQSTQLN